jgi:hypothetical protein
MTATKRMTGKDYRKELNELEKNMKSLEVHVRSRALELCKKYPDAPITRRAKGKDMTKKWINGLMTSTMIFIIEKIEKWSSDQEKIEQLTFDNIYKEIQDKMGETLEKLSD